MHVNSQMLQCASHILDVVPRAKARQHVHFHTSRLLWYKDGTFIISDHFLRCRLLASTVVILISVTNFRKAPFQRISHSHHYQCIVFQNILTIFLGVLLNACCSQSGNLTNKSRNTGSESSSTWRPWLLIIRWKFSRPILNELRSFTMVDVRSSPARAKWENTR